MQEAEINKGAELTKRLSSGRTKYPFKTMEVGEYFFVPDRQKNTLAQYASTFGRQHNRKFRTRLCFMRETLEGWVPCKIDDECSTLGIGVWRIA